MSLNKENIRKEKKFLIIRDRVETYKVFTFNLLYTIKYYYLDEKSLSLDKDIYNHFSFCYNKVCDNFLKEEINFKDNKELKDYFKHYYYHRFYRAQSNPEMDISLNYYKKFWEKIFDIENLTKKNIIRLFVELYEIFNKSINEDKNYLDIV